MNSRMVQLTLLGVFCSILGYAAFCVAAEMVLPRIPAAKELAAACRQAKAEYTPLGREDLDRARRALSEAVDRLEQYLTNNNSATDELQKLLELAKLKELNQTDTGPDLEMLNRVLAYFNSDREELELIWFLDVQEALSDYISMLTTVANPLQRSDFESRMDKLATALENYVVKPTTEDALTISEAVRWLTLTRQAPPLVMAIEAHFFHPNLFAEASPEIVGAGLAEPVEDTQPVEDCILGTAIHGTAHSVGRARTELSPHPRLGVIDMLFYGDAISDNVGYNGPVTIYSTSATQFAARKRIWIDSNGIYSHPATSTAATNIHIFDIQSDKGRRLIEFFAWRRACKQLSEAECISSLHAEQRLNDWVDKRAADSLKTANQKYLDKFRRPMTDRKLYPQELHFSTTKRALSISVLQTCGGNVAAPGAPPPAIHGADLSLRIHESMINNFAFSALAGRTFREEKLQAAVTDLIGYLPEKLKGDEDGKLWTITFSSQQPLSVTFADNGFTIALHGTSYRKGEDIYSHPMDISAVYKIEKSNQGFKAVRQGDLRVFPPEMPPHSKLGDEQQNLRKLLEHRFAKILEPELLFEGLVLPGKLKAAGKLQPIQVDAREGWGLLAWKQQVDEKKPSAMIQAAKP